ncbi:hypothetical protein KFE25_013544 [Diacronema lutheri]|uniref:Raptor N-terminal CASPase-like domain-containing protein n=1 Tax=Diacronema lutheri TaxID=2081491 RepID=A0A8J5XGK2_DIALT|nr:hypothetical protein KFE25_013544 [Diacronema lutheri]
MAGSVFTERAIRRFLSEARHGVFDVLSDEEEESIVPWRTKDRMKTVSVALVLCLNIAVDPPDVIRTQPCARLVCWIDPHSTPPQKAIESIGKQLQIQYERWQSKARYRQSLDPTHEEVRKLCIGLRRNAKEERVLLHYVGHGVPRPTANGEVWVFNRHYTQYIPLAIYDLHSWLGAPSVLVIDTSAAGLIVDAYAAMLHAQVEQQDAAERAGASAVQSGAEASPPPASPFGYGDASCGAFSHPLSGQLPSGGASSAAAIMDSVIILAACAGGETLPTSPELPADLFTSCLTTPIPMALRFCCSSPLSNVTVDMIDRIPGQLSDRRTPLGELNWIFTAVTDTIAWNSLRQPLFQRLFRQDLLLASLFRNFLLAERIGHVYQCHPVSLPRLPPTRHHHLWDAWDLAVEASLAQLPPLLAAGDGPRPAFRFSTFFAEQLTAFEVWLQFGARNRSTPEQLPVVLQVLLSQTHRLRALLLLGQFLAIGPWAVNLALSVGIFPYILKLLQSPAAELRVVLITIWARIIALDKSCQHELVKDNGHIYFVTYLESAHAPSQAGVAGAGAGVPSPQHALGLGAIGACAPPQASAPLHAPNAAGCGCGPLGVSDQTTARAKTLSLFVLAHICDHSRAGQDACSQPRARSVVAMCTALIADCASSLQLRQWACLLLGKLTEGNRAAQQQAIAEHSADCAALLLSSDASAEVRACAIFTLQRITGLVDAEPLGRAPPREHDGARRANGAARPAVDASAGDGTGDCAAAQARAAVDDDDDDDDDDDNDDDVASAELALASLACRAVDACTGDASPLVRRQLALLIARLAVKSPRIFRPAGVIGCTRGSGTTHSATPNEGPASAHSGYLSPTATLALVPELEADGAERDAGSEPRERDASGGDDCSAADGVSAAEKAAGLRSRGERRSGGSGAAHSFGDGERSYASSEGTLDTPLTPPQGGARAHGAQRARDGAAARGDERPLPASAVPFDPVAVRQAEVLCRAAVQLAADPMAAVAAPVRVSVSDAWLTQSAAIASGGWPSYRLGSAASSAGGGTSAACCASAASTTPSPHSMPRAESQRSFLRANEQAALRRSTSCGASLRRVSSACATAAHAHAGGGGYGAGAAPAAGRALAARGTDELFEWCARRFRAQMPVLEANGRLVSAEEREAADENMDGGAGAGAAADAASTAAAVNGGSSFGGATRGGEVGVFGGGSAYHGSVGTTALSDASRRVAADAGFAALPQHHMALSPQLHATNVGSGASAPGQLDASAGMPAPLDLGLGQLIARASTGSASGAARGVGGGGSKVACSSAAGGSAGSHSPPSLRHDTDWAEQRRPERSLRFEQQLTIMEVSRKSPSDGEARKSSRVSRLLFHPYRPLLATAERDAISIWEYERGRDPPCEVARFANSGATGASAARICELTLINASEASNSGAQPSADDGGPLLLVGSDDGVIRVWRNWDATPYAPPRLVTAFAAVEELLPVGPVGATRGMISLWSQRLGQLLTCSRTMAAPTVHVWDLAAERCVQRLLSGLDGADHHITSLCEVGGAHSRAVLAAGASDGSIRLYDCRSGLFSFVQVAAEHRASIVGLASHGAPAVAPVVDAPAGLSHGGTRCDLISGDVGGEVRFWDARTWSSALAADSHRIEMSCLALHERAPVAAVGSKRRTIKIFDVPGETTNSIRYYDGFLGTRIGSVGCLAFHPHKLLMAAGATGADWASMVSIYSC